jgi:DNA-binding PadR family transcriptional regulator
MKITNYQALVLLKLDGTNNEHGVWRPILAETLNTPSTTLYDNLERLQIKNLVKKYEVNDGMKGRNKVLWYATELGKKAIQVLQKGMI